MIAKRYLISGRVQGVGFRFHVERRAKELGVTGYVRNLENGDVEVVVVGSMAQHSELAGSVRKGPRLADVRSVEEQEAPMQQYGSFEIK